MWHDYVKIRWFQKMLDKCLQVLLRWCCLIFWSRKMNLIKITSVIAVSLFLTACAQPEPEVEPIAPEPVYDKYGNPV